MAKEGLTITRILLGPVSGALDGQVIERLLEHDESIEVVCATTWDAVFACLSSGRFDAVVAEFAGNDAPDIDDLHEKQDQLAIIEFDLENLDTIVHIRDVHGGVFVALARALGRPSRSVGATTGVPSKPAPIHRPASIQQSAAVYLTAEQADATVPLRNPESTKRASLFEWLDLKLSLMLARDDLDGTDRAEEDRGSPDLAGWTMSMGRARALLGAGPAALNQAELAEELRRVEQCLGSSTARGDQSLIASLSRLTERFALDDVERQMLWLVLAPELGDRYGRVFGFLNDDLTRRRPTLAILATAIDGVEDEWQLADRLVGDRPFARHRLVAHDASDLAEFPRAQAGLSCPRDLVEILFGHGSRNIRDDGPRIHRADTVVAQPDGDLEGLLAAARIARMRRASAPIVVLPTARAGTAGVIDTLVGDGHCVIEGDLAQNEDLSVGALKARVAEWSRWSVFEDAALIVRGLDGLGPRERAAAITALIGHNHPGGPLLVLAGQDINIATIAGAPGGILMLDVGMPSRSTNAALWQRQASIRGIELDTPSARSLASTFAFDRPQVEAAIAVAVGEGDPNGVNADAIRLSAARVALAAAPPAVRRIETSLGWDALVLPAEIKRELMAMPVQIEHGTTVWDAWGFAARVPYGQGVAALFAGPSGTGKTMAAQIVAREMQVPLFHVDLAQTVSKYIGDTEKALERVFDAAEASGAVLLFDEADALFGKRSEVKDAHDRYANIEVAYLLQRIEAFRGLAVLTTNAKQNIDPAFLRRLRFVIDFPMPDSAQRAMIWEKMFPPAAPVAGIDFEFLARRLSLSGGSIQQIVLRAAFDAAAEHEPIAMRHVLSATRRELAKLGMQSSERYLTEAIADGTERAQA